PRRLAVARSLSVSPAAGRGGGATLAGQQPAIAATGPMIPRATGEEGSPASAGRWAMGIKVAARLFPRDRGSGLVSQRQSRTARVRRRGRTPPAATAGPARGSRDGAILFGARRSLSQYSLARRVDDVSLTPLAGG